MARRIKFPSALMSLILPSVVVALILLAGQGLGLLILLLVTEAITIYVCVELLTERMPVKLRSLSRANCYRLDGTRSHRRSARERKALWRVRSDLWAAFLFVAMVGTGGIYFVHVKIFPIQLAGLVVNAAQDNPQNLADALRMRHVDRQYYRWSRATTLNSREEINQNERWLWNAWPLFFIVLGSGIFAGVALIRYTYLRTLREFHEKVAARSTEYLDLDLNRLQGL